ncbi:hypothetical protein SUGI_1140460 [Cryptomeria japonica]|nr:hypothetical protein SUGI_1140460 [Cryptomeria japonica]
MGHSCITSIAPFYLEGNIFVELGVPGKPNGGRSAPAQLGLHHIFIEEIANFHRVIASLTVIDGSLLCFSLVHLPIFCKWVCLCECNAYREDLFTSDFFLAAYRQKLAI